MGLNDLAQYRLQSFCLTFHFAAVYSDAAAFCRAARSWRAIEWL